MRSKSSRRDFVRSAAFIGAAVGLGDACLGLPRVSAAEARWDPSVVRFDEGIEPLVQLLERTPRERLLEVFAQRIKQGTSYRDVLTALHLAGIRNIPPRPDVGWKFHAVLVLHSAHLASMAAQEEERWLPIFFALDFFKSQQMYDERESDWSMGPVAEAHVPEPGKARAAFVSAMDSWDSEAADAAVAGLVRGSRPEEVFELFALYGMRDFRNIGHKPIYVANGWRTLEYLGRQHAEPMVRSLVYALLNHHDQPNPASSELEADSPWRSNQQLADKLKPEWSRGEISSSATAELLSTLRTQTWSEASEHVVELLNGGVAPQSIQDGIFAGAAELLIRQPGIVALHGMTATNALAYAFRTSKNDRTRRLLLLQNAAFMVQFREELKEMGPWGDGEFDALVPGEIDGSADDALVQIFDLIGNDGEAASSKALAYFGKYGAQDFIHGARRSNMMRCVNGHDYKFMSAVMEDYQHISPEWRDRYLASSVHYLRGSRSAQNRLVDPTLTLLAT